MPFAIPIAAGAAATAASAATAVGATAASITAAGFYGALIGGASYLLSTALAGKPVTSDGAVVTPADVGIGFSPTQNYPSNELPVPVLYGRARIDVPIIHQRAYGSNFDRVHYVGIVSEVGSSIEDVLIDNVPITDLPNYYTKTGNIQDENSSWYNSYPQGGKATLVYSNAGTFGISLSTSEEIVYPNNVGVDLTAQFPVVFYGGGFVEVSSFHQFGPGGSIQEWDYEFINQANPTEIVLSGPHAPVTATDIYISGGALRSTTTDFTTWNLAEQTDSGETSAPSSYQGAGLRLSGFSNAANNRGLTVGSVVSANEITLYEQDLGPPLVDEAAGSAITVNFPYRRHFSDQVGTGFNADQNVGNGLVFYHTVQSPSFRPNTQWTARMRVRYNDHGLNEDLEPDQSTIGWQQLEVSDNIIIEHVPANASFVHVHLVKDESITANNPKISVIASTSTISGTGGNPADALHRFLTDPVSGIAIAGVNIDFISVLDTVYWCELNGLSFNRAYGSFYPYDQVIREITTAGRILLLNDKGVLRLRPDEAELPTYKVAETETIVGSIKVGKRSATSPNAIEAQYIEPFYDYTSQRIPLEDIELAAKFGLQKQTVDLAGVTDQTQAYTIAWLILQQMTQCKFWCEFSCGLHTVSEFRVGDVIEVESVTNEVIGTKQWRVFEIIEIDPINNPQVYNISCGEYKDAVYDTPDFTPWLHEFDTFLTQRLSSQGWPGPASGPADVVGFRVTEVSYPTGVWISTIKVDFEFPTERADSVTIQYSLDPFTSWEDITTVTTGPVTFSVGTRYDTVKIRAVTNYGSQTNEATAPTLSYYVSGRGQQAYTGGESGTFTVGSGVTLLKIKAWAAGGSGGVGQNDTIDGGGGGAGGGGYCESLIEVAPGETFDYVVADTTASAADVYGQDGNDGGSTTFDTLSASVTINLDASGGVKGAGSTGGVPGVGGAGGAATGGDVDTAGEDGTDGTNGIGYAAGDGGDGGSASGTGGTGPVDISTPLFGRGDDGVVPGGGGSGTIGGTLSLDPHGYGAAGQLIVAW